MVVGAPSNVINEIEEFDGAGGKPHPERGLSAPYCSAACVILFDCSPLQQ